MQFYLKVVSLSLFLSFIFFRRVKKFIELIALFDIGRFYVHCAFHILVTTFLCNNKIIYYCICNGLNSLFSIQLAHASARKLITQRRRRTFYRIPIKSEPPPPSKRKIDKNKCAILCAYCCCMFCLCIHFAHADAI